MISVISLCAGRNSRGIRQGLSVKKPLDRGQERTGKKKKNNENQTEQPQEEERITVGIGEDQLDKVAAQLNGQPETSSYKEYKGHIKREVCNEIFPLFSSLSQRKCAL